MSSVSEVGYIASPALQMLRSGNMPLALVMVQFVFFDEHLIGSAGGVESTP
ncbi:hypothetical protein TSUD_348050 [Trifolium subterraneum]|nr:hypothetical protein TSUD_348050 [Trifolium subterraneum]